jgi:hypothetical protein
MNCCETKEEIRVTPMTEAEWLVSEWPRTMLGLASQDRPPWTNRKIRLFICACCRRAWDLMLDPRSKKAIEVSELFADKPEHFKSLQRAHVNARAAEEDLSRRQSSNASRIAASAAARSAENSLRDWSAWNASRAAAEALGQVGMWEEELVAQANLLRDIFGNPFLPLPPCPEAIAPLAESIYLGEWKLMPILGEWLQENGYWSEGDHCLDPRIQHVKGCWVVDWVTGRE